MIRNEEGGVELEESEANLLGLMMASIILADDEVIEWEDLPELTEESFTRVLAAIGRVTDQIEEALETNGLLLVATKLYEEVS